ncbi:MAG: ABC transporter substrate-binding protein, partial [Rhodospirillales bacterium]|nr:ABC transporter substrate-binding protein [Rhodospirillales bacterium]
EFLMMTPNKDTGKGQYNSGNYSNAELDKLTLQSQGMTDEAARVKVLKRIEGVAYADAAFVPLHWQDLAWAAKKGVGAEAILNVMNFPYIGDIVIK